MSSMCQPCFFNHVQCTVQLLSIQTITFCISVLNQDPEQQYAKTICPGVAKSRALATLLSDQAIDTVQQLYTAPNIGKRFVV